MVKIFFKNIKHFVTILLFSMILYRKNYGKMVLMIIRKSVYLSDYLLKVNRLA
jgi:hypothetical protein